MVRHFKTVMNGFLYTGSVYTDTSQ